jgi:hypothetical protein
VTFCLTLLTLNITLTKLFIYLLYS